MANGGASLGVVLRRSNPQDGGKVAVGRTHSNAGVRRSRNLETKSEYRKRGFPSSNIATNERGIFPIMGYFGFPVMWLCV